MPFEHDKTIFRPWKPFLDKISITFTRRVPLGTWNLEFWVCRTSSWPKRPREPKLLLSRSYGLGCRWGTNFCQRPAHDRRKWKNMFSEYEIPKIWKSAIFFFLIFPSRFQFFPFIFHMRQVKLVNSVYHENGEHIFWLFVSFRQIF
jgi:hypothetical protein